MQHAAGPMNVASFPSLRGRNVFVTGGGSGIGAAMVEAFAAQGAHVAFVDVAAEASAALAARVESRGQRAPTMGPAACRMTGDEVG